MIQQASPDRSRYRERDIFRRIKMYREFEREKERKRKMRYVIILSRGIYNDETNDYAHQAHLRSRTFD